MTPSERPTYNHTRGDAPIAPCEACAATPVERNMASIIADLEADNARLRIELDEAQRRWRLAEQQGAAEYQRAEDWRIRRAVARLNEKRWAKP
jgi:hypothetical protein